MVFGCLVFFVKDFVDMLIRSLYVLSSVCFNICGVIGVQNIKLSLR